MTFQEIFNEDGLYIPNIPSNSVGFTEGFAFRIKDGTLTGIQYKTVDDLLPEVYHYPVHKSLFDLTCKKVLLIKHLFR